MNRKWAIFILAGFFGGVFLSSFVTAGVSFASLLLVVSAALGAIFYFKPGFSNFIFYCSVFLAAFSLGILRYEINDSRENLAPFFASRFRPVTLSGVIAEEPEQLEKFTRAILKTDSAGPARSAKILLTLPHYPEIKYGDGLQVEGKLREPENFGPPAGGFDWKAYLAKDNIYFEMFLPRILSREEGRGLWFKRILFKAKRAFIENISKVLPEPQSSFMAGLTVGERSGFPKSLEDGFRKVGVIHLVVLSGYNISVVAASVLAALAWLPLSKIFQIFLASLGIILFSVMTGGSATIVRAAIMGILLLFARSTGKIYEALVSLLAAVFLMVLINPKILRFDVSFQLSFLATLSLIIFLPKLEKRFLWLPNPLHLKEHFLATLSTQLFVLPLLLQTSGIFSLVSIPANLLILGAVPITMFFGFLAGAAGFFSGILSKLFSWPAYLLLSYELGVVKFFSKFSFAIFEISKISGWLVLALYFVLALFIFYLNFRERAQV